MSYVNTCRVGGLDEDIMWLHGGLISFCERPQDGALGSNRGFNKVLLLDFSRSIGGSKAVDFNEFLSYQLTFK